MLEKGICVLFLVLAQIAFAQEKDAHIVQYTEETFPKEIVKKNHFVMFYVPWCGHSMRLAPIWEQLAETLNKNGDSRVQIGKVDCITHRPVCSDQDITEYPTLKFFKVGESKGTKFRGARDVPTLIAFIDEQLNNTVTVSIMFSIRSYLFNFDRILRLLSSWF
ncbi:thioredoxin domain-containing protein 5 homolog [Cephus cinctus]|uniref:Thioredoxin domain-containing protein 5 homolog n=1 Tax=Cephus cinctus TaxID=211228 RepID=A0AAJ7W883_CEPCN|nr:thioredoxin domain-containing protein 5 homolog [Cephus cinctus]